MSWIHISILFALSFGALACGVKGKPLPPLTPPTLGRGEPNFSKATENLKLRKKKNTKIEGDWEEATDFPEGNEE